MKLGAKGAARAVAAAAFFAGAAAGCNFIVGVGDYAVGDAEINEGRDATQPDEDSGQSMMDVRGSEPVSETGSGADVHDASLDRGADVTLDARPDTSTGGGGDAEAGGADATADADASDGGNTSDASDASYASDASDGGTGCGSSFPNTTAFHDLVATCVYAASCDPDIVPVGISDCVTNDILHGPGPNNPISCLAGITSCDDYYACEGTRVSTLNECPTLDGFCNGSVATNCDFDNTQPLFGIVTNCALISGGTCIQFSTSTGIEADCVVQSGCTASATPTPECLGNDLSFNGCEASPVGGANVALGRSCGNATCTALSGGSCTFETTGLCANEVTSTCTGGSVLQACSSPAQSFTYACGTAGGQCQQVTGNSAQCVSPGCSPSQVCDETCNSATGLISVCIGGAPFPIDCHAYGFSSCGSTTSTAGAATIAYCTR